MKVVSSSQQGTLKAAQWTCARCRSAESRRTTRFFSSSRTHFEHQSRRLGDNSQYRSVQTTVNTRCPTKTALEDVARRKSRLPDGPARTRFAPSPTGYLHIGGLRTALFSYLLAKRTGGQFLLRIEDTDQKRLVPDAEARLFEDLQWAGLSWDEGPQVGGPHGSYRQSERNDIYQHHAKHVLDRGAAYRCFCSPQTSGAGQAAYVTSGCYQSCSSWSPDESQERAEGKKESFTVRLRLPPDVRKRVYPDLVYGSIQRLKLSPAAPQPISSAEDGGDTGIDAADTVLVKSDGTPTYHFANVVDDHLMEITHVIRGAEWMASTPLHYDIYHAFGWKPPQFAHVGLLVDQNQAKLSKRNQDLALDVASMRHMHGVLPYSLNNFLALLGWSNPTTNDVMDREMLISNFDLKFTRGNTMVKTEKLWYLQKKHVTKQCLHAREMNDLSLIQDITSQIVTEVMEEFPEPLVNGQTTFEEHKATLPDQLHAYCADILLADSKNYTNAKGWLERHRYLFSWDPSQVPEPTHNINNAEGPPGLQARALVSTAQSLVTGFAWRASEVQSTSATTSSSNPHYRAIENLERRLHIHLTNGIWDLALDDLVGMQEAGSLDPDLSSLSKEEIEAWRERRPKEAAHPLNASTLVEQILPTAEEGHKEKLEAALKSQYKKLNTVILKYLRERLAYGMPGPSVSWIMALLGELECRRRLK